jgi:hypothetical protein
MIGICVILLIRVFFFQMTLPPANELQTQGEKHKAFLLEKKFVLRGVGGQYALWPEIVDRVNDGIIGWCHGAASVLRELSREPCILLLFFSACNIKRA